MKVTPDDIHQIHTYLTEQGLTTNEVRADVLDHICIMLEQQPDGLDRATVSALVEAEFPSQVIKQIQADTLYYLTLTSKITMLKFIFITGYVSVCLLVLGSFLVTV